LTELEGAKIRKAGGVSRLKEVSDLPIRPAGDIRKASCMTQLRRERMRAQLLPEGFIPDHLERVGQMAIERDGVLVLRAPSPSTDRNGSLERGLGLIEFTPVVVDAAKGGQTIEEFRIVRAVDLLGQAQRLLEFGFRLLHVDLQQGTRQLDHVVNRL